MMKEFKNILDSIVNNAIDEANKEMHSTALSEILTNNTDLVFFQSASKFSLLQYKVDSIFESFLMEYKKVPKQNKNNYCFVFFNYKFLKNHIVKFISKITGGVCSVDQFNFIINSYLRNLINPINVDKITYNEYYHPFFGSIQEWFDLIDACRLLYYGNIDDYILQTIKMENNFKDPNNILSFSQLTFYVDIYREKFELLYTLENDILNIKSKKLGKSIIENTNVSNGDFLHSKKTFINYIDCFNNL